MSYAVAIAIIVAVSFVLAFGMTIAIRLALRPPAPEPVEVEPPRPASARRDSAATPGATFRALGVLAARTPSPEPMVVRAASQRAQGVPRRNAPRFTPVTGRGGEVARGVPCWVCFGDAAVGNHDHRRSL